MAIGDVLWPRTGYNREPETRRGHQSAAIFQSVTSGRIESDISKGVSPRRFNLREVIGETRRPAPMRAQDTRLRLRGINSLRCLSDLRDILLHGRSWIIDLAQASGARFVHMVYGSWPILGCTVGYSANGTFRIILLVIRWPINKNQDEMRDRF